LPGDFGSLIGDFGSLNFSFDSKLITGPTPLPGDFGYPPHPAPPTESSRYKNIC
jgi:hypothetical protein